MDPLWILFLGMVVVVGGVLALRLHAFLALVAGALVVAVLTPPDRLAAYGRKEYLKPLRDAWKDDHRADPAAGPFVPDTTQAADANRRGEEVASLTIGDRVAGAFGKTCGDIGILIAMASIVGKCLLDSGGADRIIRSTLRALGEQRAALAFLASGFVLGIPVFFDTVFYLMIPLGKALHVRTGKDYLLYVLSISAGATMTHSLVPPTPGPLFVADELNVDMGLMILAGCLVGAVTSTVGYQYARWANRRWAIPLRVSGGVSLAELEQLATRDESELPALWLALLPIVLPVVLICSQTLVESLPGIDPSAPLPRLLATLGNKHLALGLSAVIAIVTLARQRRSDPGGMSAAIEESLLSAGGIILVTAAGGAFGGMLQQSGIADRIKELAPAGQSFLIPLAFLVTALVRTAQGSSTVAMITAAGIFSSFATPEALGCHPVYLALAIGCGSKPYAWMNDSGFWVVCRMTGFTEGEMLKVYSPLTTIMGIVGIGVVMLAAWCLPLA